MNRMTYRTLIKFAFQTTGYIADEVRFYYQKMTSRIFITKKHKNLP